MHERDELEMDRRHEDREERYWATRDEQGEWLDCGCHSNQSDHSCGERERSDEDDERNAEEASDMDPNATLAELRQAIKAANDSIRTADYNAATATVLERFAALDEWLTNNGFPPDAWNSRSPSPASWSRATRGRAE